MVCGNVENMYIYSNDKFTQETDTVDGRDRISHSHSEKQKNSKVVVIY